MSVSAELCSNQGAVQWEFRLSSRPPLWPSWCAGNRLGYMIMGIAIYS